MSCMDPTYQQTAIVLMTCVSVCVHVVLLRGYSPHCVMSLSEASGSLKLQLSKVLTDRAHQHLLQATGDPSSANSAAQTLAHAVSMARAAAADAQAAGAVLLQVEALQLAARVLIKQVEVQAEGAAAAYLQQVRPQTGQVLLQAGQQLRQQRQQAQMASGVLLGRQDVEAATGHLKVGVVSGAALIRLRDVGELVSMTCT